MIEYDWESLLMQIKKFARVDNITEIIILGEGEGEGQGIRRIKLSDE